MKKKDLKTTFILIRKSNNKGFSLIEILVALFLMSVVFAIVITGGSSTRQTLEEAVENIERAVRFSTDEAALRNTIMRIRFLLDKTPQEYVVEYGPDDSFVIPTSRLNLSERVGLSEQAKLDKEKEKIDRKFNKVREFQSSNKSIPDEIRIVGVGSSLQDRLISDMEVSIYIYPTGEKDGACIVFGSEEEVISLSIDPFTTEFKRKYVTIENTEYEDIMEKQLNIASELYSEWQSE